MNSLLQPCVCVRVFVCIYLEWCNLMSVCALPFFYFIRLSKCLCACLLERNDGHRVECLEGVKQEREEDWFWALNKHTVLSSSWVHQTHICPARHSNHLLSCNAADDLCVCVCAAVYAACRQSVQREQEDCWSNLLPPCSFSRKSVVGLGQRN